MLRGGEIDIDPSWELGDMPDGRGASGAGGRGAGIGDEAGALLAFFLAGCRLGVFFAVDLRDGWRFVALRAVDLRAFFAGAFGAVFLAALLRVVFLAALLRVVFLAALFGAVFLAALLRVVFLAAPLRAGIGSPPW